MRHVWICVCVSTIACKQNQEAKVSSPQGGAQPLNIKAPKGTAAGTLGERFERYDDAYQLKPDKRFLSAIKVLRQLQSQKVNGDVTVRLESKRWKISMGSEPLGDVSLLPDFPELFDLIRKSGHSETDAKKTPPSEIGWTVGREAVLKLRDANKLWKAGDRSPTQLRTAARLLTAVLLQMKDTRGIADGLAAQALAVLALAEEAAGEELQTERIGLSYALDYRNYAHKTATQVSDDELAGYLGREDADLVNLAAKVEPGTLGALWLQRRLTEIPPARFQNWQRQLDVDSWPIEAHTAIAQMRLSTFSNRTDAAETALAAVLLEAAGKLEPEPKVPRKAAPSKKAQKLQIRAHETDVAQLTKTLQQEPLLPAIESHLKMPSKAAEGELWPEALEQSYYQALAFDALDHLAKHAIDSLAPVPAAKTFSERLGKATTPETQAYEHWLKLIVGLMGDARNHQAVIKAFTELDVLGTRSKIRLYEEILNHAEWFDAALPLLVRELAARMDSRVNDRVELARMAKGALYDVALEEQLYRSIYDARADTVTAVHLAKISKDFDSLQKLAADVNLQPQARLHALLFVLEQGPASSQAAANQEMERLLRSNGDEWPLLRQYTTWLMEHDQAPRAREWIEKWLEWNRKSQELVTLAAARTALAETYEREKRFAEAWKTIEPAIKAFRAPTLFTASRLAAKLGKKEQALELAKACTERYPGVESVGAQAAVLWILREDRAAANLLAETRLRAIDWNSTVAKQFAEGNQNRPAKEAIGAFAEVVKPHQTNPFDVFPLAKALGKLQPETGVEMLMLPKIGHPMQDMIRKVMAYQLLTKARTKEEALKWLDSQLGANVREPLSRSVIEDEVDELMWTLVAFPEGNSETADAVWFNRAVSTVRTNDQSEEHWAKLRKRFSVDSGSVLHRAGQVLADTRKPETLFGESAANDIGIAAAALGVKARAQGKIGDAIKWFRIAVENSQVRQSGFRLAADQLHDLSLREESIALLSKSPFKSHHKAAP